MRFFFRRLLPLEQYGAGLRLLPCGQYGADMHKKKHSHWAVLKTALAEQSCE